jgi:hypothetical protein
MQHKGPVFPKPSRARDSTESVKERQIHLLSASLIRLAPSPFPKAGARSGDNPIYEAVLGPDATVAKTFCDRIRVVNPTLEHGRPTIGRRREVRLSDPDRPSPDPGFQGVRYLGPSARPSPAFIRDLVHTREGKAAETGMQVFDAHCRPRHPCERFGSFGPSVVAGFGRRRFCRPAQGAANGNAETTGLRLL